MTRATDPARQRGGLKGETGHFYFGENRTSVLCADNGLRGPSPDFRALTDGQWRLIYDETRPGYLELFDKELDPREQRNVAPEEPRATEDLMAKVHAYLSRSDAPWGESPLIEIDEMQMRQLRAIGYGVE